MRLWDLSLVTEISPSNPVRNLSFLVSQLQELQARGVVNEILIGNFLHINRSPEDKPLAEPCVRCRLMAEPDAIGEAVDCIRHH